MKKRKLNSKPQVKGFKYWYRRVITIIWILIELLPLYWMLVLPWKTWDDALNSPFALPTTFTFTNFQTVLSKFNIPRGMLNSFLYALIIAASACFFGLLAAYGLTRMRKKSALFFDKYLKLGLVMPAMCLVSTTFLILKKLNLIGTFWAVVLPTTAILQCATTLSFSVWFKRVPTEYEEAAVVYGCGPFRLFTQIMVPQIAPAILIQFTTIFILIWNNYEQFKVYALGKAPTPVTIMIDQLFHLQKSQDWGIIGAGILMSSIPSIIVYCFFNKYLQKAYTGSGSLK